MEPCKLVKKGFYRRLDSYANNRTKIVEFQKQGYRMPKDDNAKWFEDANLSRYSGMWIAVCNNKLIAKDTDPSVVMKAARTCKMHRPTIMKVPKKNQISIL